MSKSDKPGLRDWLGFTKPFNYAAAPWLGPIVSGVMMTAVGGLFLLAIISAFGMLTGAVFGTLLERPGSSLGVGGVTVALIGAPFVVWRSIVAQKTLNVTEQGHITDRINTAVEGLGAEKTVKRDGEERTAPNLEVRIGAIYALERIAQDSDRDHVQIMEILCAYIRQNAPASEAKDWPELTILEGEDDGPLGEDWKTRVAVFKIKQQKAKADLDIRDDIQVALTVIGRRSTHQRGLEAKANNAPEGSKFVFDSPCPDPDKYLPTKGHDAEAMAAFKADLEVWQHKLIFYQGFRLDLRRTNLQGADLAGLNLNGARLDSAQLQGANLGAAQLQGAVLSEARLQGAFLSRAQLQGADLSEARLQGAFLSRAQLQGADLSEARLQGAFLSRAQLQGADLSEARLQGAVLRAAQLQGAVLYRVRLQGAFLGAARLQGAFLREAQMDSDTSLNAATFRGAALREVNYSTIVTPKYPRGYRVLGCPCDVRAER